MDKRLDYYYTSKYSLINMLNDRNCRLKYAFTRTKLQLIELLHRLDNGEDGRVVARDEMARFRNMTNEYV